MTAANTHEPYDVLLQELGRNTGIQPATLGRVLVRVMVAAPRPVPQIEIARGSMLARPTEMSPAVVNRAVAALCASGLLTKLSAATLGPGRPVVPLQLGSEQWGLIGVHVAHRNGCIVGLLGMLTTLNLTVLAVEEVDFGDLVVPEAEVAERSAALIKLLLKDPSAERRRILGVGIEIGGHVYRDQVVAATNVGWRHVDLGEELAKRIGFPVTVENDVNARVVRESYRRTTTERDFALVCVFEDGVGGALAIDRRLYQGAGGSAGEVGHVLVDFPLGAPKISRPEAQGFSGACSCGRYGHVDALATPARIAAELQTSDLTAEARGPAFDDQEKLTPTASVFRHAGMALGRGLATMATLVNPGRLLLLLPPVLGTPVPGTAAGAYLAAVEATLNEAFSTASADARAGGQRLTISILKPEDRPRDGAQAAAVCALHSFVDHARGRDSCGVPTP